MAFLSLLILLSLCGICRSKDRCFQKSRLEDAEQLVEDPNVGDISAHENGGSAGNIEMPDRAKRYQIRQRNYDID
jgi:hypothetical protein